MMDNEYEKQKLMHFGVLGMKWGHRKSSEGSISRSTNKMAKKDAQRFMDAKMFYGETAGTKRKLLKAELMKKRKNIPGYEEAFNKHLEEVDTAKSANRAVRKRVAIDTIDNGRRLAKKILNITGPLVVTAGATLYYANKTKVDSFVKRQFNNVIDAYKHRGGRGIPVPDWPVRK